MVLRRALRRALRPPAFWLGRLFWHGGDEAIINRFGPDGVAQTVLQTTDRVVKIQTGYVYHYAFAMMLGVAVFITWYPRRGRALMFGFGILSGLIAIPLIGVLFILVLRGEDEATLDNARWAALIASVVTFLLSLVAWGRFDTGTSAFQLVESRPWLGGGLGYKLGVDGASMPFILLTTFLMPFCIASAWRAIHTRVKEFLICFLVLEAALIGIFSALDIVLFYLFFEGSLIPMFLIIGIWGGQRRIYASMKFFLYTLLGSLLMLLAIMKMYGVAGTTDITVLLATKFPVSMQYWLWLAFFASFAVKMPMWPVHTWLPDAHVEAPTAGSVVLAGHPAEARGLRLHPLLAAHVPRGVLLFRAPRLRPVGHRHHLHLTGGARSDRHEEADRLFVGRPHGLRHHGPLHPHGAGHPGCHLPHDQPRPRGRAPSSSASAWSTTGCTHARSRPTAASSSACRNTPW